MNIFLNSTRKVALRYCRITFTIFTTFCGKSYHAVKETTCRYELQCVRTTTYRGGILQAIKPNSIG